LENPYTSPELAEHEATPSFATIARWQLLLVFGLSAFVIVTCVSATQLRFDFHTTFMHTVFFTSPLAIFFIARLCSSDPQRGDRLAVIAIAILTLLAFLFSWNRYFSNNPYESFVLTNWYFGPYGWMQWTWLVATVGFPLIMHVPRLLSNTTTRRLIAILVVIGYIHNAYHVWILTHGAP
jgi:hypothetical protein